MQGDNDDLEGDDWHDGLNPIAVETCDAENILSDPNWENCDGDPNTGGTGSKDSKLDLNDSLALAGDGNETLSNAVLRPPLDSVGIALVCVRPDADVDSISGCIQSPTYRVLPIRPFNLSNLRQDNPPCQPTGQVKP